MSKKKVTELDASLTCGCLMPKAMSDWLDRAILFGDYIELNDNGKTGYLIKSLDCSIAFFPDWNCDEQVARIANKLNVR